MVALESAGAGGSDEVNLRKRQARARRKAKANRLERWQRCPVWRRGTPEQKPAI